MNNNRYLLRTCSGAFTLEYSARLASTPLFVVPFYHPNSVSSLRFPVSLSLGSHSPFRPSHSARCFSYRSLSFRSQSPRLALQLAVTIYLANCHRRRFHSSGTRRFTYAFANRYRRRRTTRTAVPQLRVSFGCISIRCVDSTRSTRWSGLGASYRGRESINRTVTPDWLVHSYR